MKQLLKYLGTVLMASFLFIPNSYALDQFDEQQAIRITDGVTIFGETSGDPLHVLTGANSGVDIGDVDVTSITPGTGALNLGKAEDEAHVSGDVGILGLAVRQDVQADFAADGDYTPFSINADGELRVTTSTINVPSNVDDSAFVIATDAVAPVGYLVDETATDSADEGDTGIARMTADRKQLSVLVDATTDANRLAIDGSGAASVNFTNTTIAVTATDLDIRALDSVTDSIEVLQDTHDDLNLNANIQIGNSDVGPANAVPVTFGDPAASTTDFKDYDTAAAVVKLAVSNHDFTVTGTEALISKITVSASGAMKAEIQSGPIASLVTQKVVFTTASNPTMVVEFDPPLEVPVTGTGTIRVIRTNRAKSAQDLYSTIEGWDI